MRGFCFKQKKEEQKWRVQSEEAGRTTVKSVEKSVQLKKEDPQSAIAGRCVAYSIGIGRGRYCSLNDRSSFNSTIGTTTTL